MKKTTMSDFTNFFEQTENMFVFCDMDGVLVDWENHFIQYVGKRITAFPKPKLYKKIASLSIEWWATIPWLSDGKELWNYIYEITPKGNLYILSSPARDKEHKSEKGKWKWLKENGIEAQIGSDHIIITEDKHKHVQNEKSILIDDTPKKINKWVNAGGIGILHTSTKDTLNKLNDEIYN